MFKVRELKLGKVVSRIWFDVIVHVGNRWLLSTVCLVTSNVVDFEVGFAFLNTALHCIVILVPGGEKNQAFKYFSFRSMPTVP